MKITTRLLTNNILKNIYISFLLCSLFFTKPIYAEIVDKVVAKINSEIITLSEVDEKAHAINIERKMTNIGIEESKKQAETLVNLMIDEILQVQYAKKKGIKVEDQVVYAYVDEIKRKNSLTDETLREILKKEFITYEGYVEKLREQMMISRLVNSEIKSRILVEESEIDEYYNKHIDEFMEPESVNVRHIFFRISEDMKKETRDIKEAVAKNVLKELHDGKDFIDLAKTYSDGPNAESGGETGFFERGTMASEIENTAFSLEDGQISGLIKSKYGFHILKVIEKRKKRAKGIETVRKAIEKRIFDEKVKSKYSEWMRELRARSYIDILF